MYAAVSAGGSTGTFQSFQTIAVTVAVSCRRYADASESDCGNHDKQNNRCFFHNRIPPFLLVALFLLCVFISFLNVIIVIISYSDRFAAEKVFMIILP